LPGCLVCLVVAWFAWVLGFYWATKKFDFLLRIFRPFVYLGYRFSVSAIFYHGLPP